MAKISVSCKSCGKRYGVPDTYAGKRFKCKDCGAAVQVPAPEEPEPVDDESDFEEEKPAPKKHATARRRPSRGRPAAARGRGRAEPVEEEEPAPRGRGGATRGRRPPAAGGRRGRTTHGHDDDDHGYGRHGPKEPSKALVYGSAGGSILIILFAILYFGFLHEKGEHPVKKNKRKAAATAGLERPDIGDIPEEDDPGIPDTEPETPPEPEVKPEPVVKQPEPNVTPKKPEKVEPKEEKLAAIPRADIRKLDHYDATPEEQRKEIDAAVVTMSDPWAGAAGNRAMAAITKIGKAAVPVLLSAMVDLDFKNEEDRMKMPKITDALRELTKTPMSYVCRVGMRGDERKEIHNCEYNRAQWFEWWDRYGKSE